ncbi:DUF1028 domain-containing protein [Aurantibacillus circumpalustris]|uniref:DUF1028 domain-containing protein n=1 Tax=Aurantibacillus circumpalustris TaxID=3036359 RepID=UPI00295B3502|nr:DUF1028 domain-containing protein [Aurantibacillus circumpalustris]
MRIRNVYVAVILSCNVFSNAQDTFSILAFDSITGEVGAAGASCVDLFPFPAYSNHFIAEIFPGEGAIATQAAYIAANQINAKNRFTAGDSPTQIINWLQANDAQSTIDAQTRQYGVVRMNTSNPKSAGFTGANCMNYKNHITGPNYSIQGNILLGQMVLDSMEARFNREPGDLACKLMAAMEGAKMIGADSRCTSNGSSSLFAFLKVAQPGDLFGQPSLLVSLKTPANSGIEPIDSLQILFNAERTCTYTAVGLEEHIEQLINFQLFPNPSSDKVVLRSNNPYKEYTWLIRNILGAKIESGTDKGQIEINTLGWKKGLYTIEIRVEKTRIIKKFTVN